MKVIFLDIDGVLNLNRTERDQYGRLFHDGFVGNLGTIIDRTGAKIVVSSTWRFSGLGVMQEMWRDRKLPGDVVSITHDLWTGKLNDGCTRGDEIEHWLNGNDVENYVILDDDSDMLDDQMGHIILTSGNTDHPDSLDGYGLTEKCALEAIDTLNNVTT